jgi:oligoendopeptidase F
MDLDKYRRRMEAFSEALSRESYEGRAGLKERVSYAAVYEAYADLFTREAVDALDSAVKTANGRESLHRLKLLLESVTLAYISNRTRKLREDAENFEAAAEVELPSGEKIPYRASAVRMLNEPGRETRRRLEDARRAIVLKKNEFLEMLHRDLHALAGELGYGSYLDMLGTIKAYPLEPVRDAMRAFLEATETLYAREMGAALEGIGTKLDEAARHDAGYLFRGGEFDALFPPDGIAGAVAASVKRMGLDLSADGRIVLDLEARPTKSPRAFCATPRVPDEVLLVVLPRGGMDDYHAFLHELGHALHFAWVRPDAPFEYRRLGDNSVTEGFAMLFDHLLLNDRWLREALGIENAERILRHQHLHELYMLRRYAAKIDYELILHESAGLSGKGDVYAGKLGRANRIRYTPSHYLEDVDAHFYCANYLRAWMLQAALAEELTGRFGENWFHDSRAGALLKEIWADGQKDNAEGILARLIGDGGRPLSPDPLRAAIERRLDG